MFPSMMKKFNVPHFEILGALGDAIFCAKFVSQKCAMASKLLTTVGQGWLCGPPSHCTPLVPMWGLSWSVCTSRSWLWMGTRQFQDTASRHPCYPQLPLTLLLHPHLSQLICLKRACTRVFQQRQQSTENIQKMISSVLSWAGNVLPFTLESYGAWGPEALRVFTQVATRLAIRGNTPKSKVVAELHGHLSLSLVRANARSILVHSYPQTPQQENENELFT